MRSRERIKRVDGYRTVLHETLSNDIVAATTRKAASVNTQTPSHGILQILWSQFTEFKIFCHRKLGT